jgi:hypothetical protein
VLYAELAEKQKGRTFTVEGGFAFDLHSGQMLAEGHAPRE